MKTEFLVLIPPILVLIVAFLTKKIRNSLIVGIITAALILDDFVFTEAVKTILTRLSNVLEVRNLANWESFWASNNLFIFLFLLVLGIIITTLEYSGSAFAYGKFVKQKLKSARSVECSSLFLSLFFFVDDYFSSLTVGSVMQPVTDIFQIPRVKLGLLVNAIAVPTAIIIPISSWVATISGQLQQTGISAVPDEKTTILCDPFLTYLATIPFLFYAFIIVLSLWVIALRRISYGIIAKHESIAQNTGNLFGGKTPVTRASQTVQTENHSVLFDFVFPIILLIILSIFEILRSGDFFLFGGSNGLVAVFAHSNIQAALFKGSLVTVLIMIIYFLMRKTIKIEDVPQIIFGGVKMMYASIVVLILILTFSGMLRFDLQIGSFIAKNLLGSISISLLPFIFFVTAATIATLIGSAWGTFGVLIPIGIPMLITLSQAVVPVDPSQIPMLYPLLGAIISGSVAGTHMSPISDVMLMSATSTGCYHIDLVKTQTSIALPAIISAASAFLLVGIMLQKGWGFTLSLVIAFSVGIIINFAILSTLNLLNKYKP